MADVFVSYAHADRASAEVVRKALASEGVDVWTDAQKIEPGANLGDAIFAALAEAKVIIPLISEASLASRWTQMEWGAALARAREAGVIVAPVLLEGAEVPQYLSQFNYVDGRNLSPEELGGKLRSLASRLPAHA